MNIINRRNDDGTALLLSQSGLLQKENGIIHAFSTRFGGVSKGAYESMNLSFTRGDNDEDVSENFRRIASFFGTTPDRFVLTFQTHTTNVRTVYESDAGRGVVRERNYEDVDALITNEKDLILGVFWADCVPILLYDRKNHAIGVAHSGWRGTAGKISKKTIDAMCNSFNTDPADIIAVIGPSICNKCYEISSDVAEVFIETFPDHVNEILRKRTSKKDKYMLDLWETNRIILLEAGVKTENIDVTDLCTCCNSRLMFSHRVQGEARGNNGAFLMLK